MTFSHSLAMIVSQEGNGYYDISGRGGFSGGRCARGEGARARSGGDAVGTPGREKGLLRGAVAADRAQRRARPPAAWVAAAAKPISA